MYRQQKQPNNISKRSCNICGNLYVKKYKYSEVQWSNSKYCSRECSAKAKSLKAANKPIKEKICKQCKNKFSKHQSMSPAQWTSTTYCSVKCASEKRRIHASKKDRYESFRRKHGVAKVGSVEHIEKISRLTKLAMQRPEVQEKIRQPRSPMSLESRYAKSEALKGKMPKNNTNGGKYKNVKNGWYDINGTSIYFRSMWEANYALYLDFLIDNKEIIKWEFEPQTFMFEAIKLGTRSYTPDFKVYLTDGSYEWHEVKGYFDSKSKTKMKRFAKYYPDEKLILIDSKEYLLIKKKLSVICKFFG